MVVDDDTQILESFKSILKSEGFGVNTAESGEEAVKKVKEGAFDIVLLDIKLPGIESTDALSVLRDNVERLIFILYFSLFQPCSFTLFCGGKSWEMLFMEPRILKVNL